MSAQLLTSFRVHEDSIQKLIYYLRLITSCWLVNGFNPSFLFTVSITLLNVITASDKSTWTPRGNILNSVKKEDKAVNLYNDGTLHFTTFAASPYFFSVSNDYNIYYVSSGYALFRSRDDGYLWFIVIQFSFGWNCWQVISIGDGDRAELWTHVSYNQTHRLFSCKFVNCAATQKEANSSFTVADIYKSLSGNCSRPMACADNKNVILSDKFNKVLSLLSVNSANYYQVLSPNDIHHKAYVIAVEKKMFTALHRTRYEYSDCVSVDDCILINLAKNCCKAKISFCHILFNQIETIKWYIKKRISSSSFFSEVVN